jgi:hypothetical protein
MRHQLGFRSRSGGISSIINHAGASSLAIVGVRIMAYLLPRAIMVLIAWGLTCGLIRKFSPDADPMIFFVAGASLAGAGIAYFAYLRRLKRDIDDLSRRRYSHGHSVG